MKRSVVVAALLAACASPSSSQVEYVYDPYEGAAPYPSTRPHVALPASEFAVVPSSGSDKLTVVDLAGEKSVATTPVGRNPVVLDGPHQVVGHLPSRRLFTVLGYPTAFANAGNHSHGGSTQPGWVQALSIDDLAPVAEIRVDANPGELAVSEDGKRLVVTHFDLASALASDKTLDERRSTLSVVDPAAMLPFGTPEPDKLLVCIAPHGLALSRPDAKVAFVACNGEDSVAIVDLDNRHNPVTIVPLGDGARNTGAPAYGPYGVALSPDGTRLAIGSREAHDVRFLDVATSTMSALTVPMLGEVYVPAWSKDGARLYVPTRALDAIVVIDSVTGAQILQHPFDAATCSAPIEAALAPDGTTVHVTCEGTSSSSGAIVTLDAATLEVRGRVDVGFFPGRPFYGAGP